MEITILAGHVGMKTFDVRGEVRDDWEYIGTYTFFPFLGISSNYLVVNKVLEDFFDRVRCIFPNAECAYKIDSVRDVYHVHIYFRGVKEKDLLEQGCLCWNWGYYVVSNSKGQVLNYHKHS